MRWAAALGAAATLAAPARLEAQLGAVEGVLTSRTAVVSGAVVYLVPLEGPAVSRPLDSALVDQRNLRFVPRVLVVTPGTAVTFRNSDPIMHNVFSPGGVGADFDLGSYTGAEVRRQVFGELGAYVILCHVHPEMAAYVVVVPTALSAVADDAGRFRITGVPPGRYVLRLWHRHLRDPERAIAIGEGATLRLAVSVERSRRPRIRTLEDPEDQ